MAELNIDAALVKRGAGATLVQAQERLVEMSNGAAACTGPVEGDVRG